MLPREPQEWTHEGMLNKILITARAESQVLDHAGIHNILNVSANATQQEISRAFRKLAIHLHPDRNGMSGAHAIYEKLVQAYEELKRSEPKPFLSLYPYHNHRTFLHLESTLFIPAEDLLVLDGYAFSVNELTEYATHNLKDFYRNPHIIQANENTSFSDAAKTKLRRHTALSQFAKALDEQLALQMNGISDATIDAVLVLLKAHENGNDAVDEAERIFGRYFFTLSAKEQARLNAYVIRVQTTSGGFQALTFEYALIGGSRFDRCTNTQQIYLWQFVVDFRPAEFQNIPPDLMRIAEILHFEIKPRVIYASSMSLEEKPDMDLYIPSLLNFVEPTFEPLQLFHSVQQTPRQSRQSGHAVSRSME
jgi:hypothetical protein